MTFLNEIKEELLNVRVKGVNIMASEVRGILTFGGAEYNGSLLFGTESFVLAKKMSSFLRRVCNIDMPQRIDEGAESYKFLIPESVLDVLGLEINAGVIEDKSGMETDFACMRAYVRGAFLASGSAANPDKAYRIEIFSENKNAIDKLMTIFDALSVDAKTAKRKNLFVVYANTIESAADMLKVTEATGAVFKMLEARVEKERRNDTNRLFNCDMANIDRVNENSRREADAIRLIAKRTRLDSLKPKLREAALLRLENEGASLKELCEMLDPPVAKSTLNNRLNKLIQIAKEMSD